MKTLALKIIAFIFLFLIINQLIKLFTPYWWGNPYYAEKIKYFNENPDGYNMVFFGSSRTYRQTDPKLFDSLVHKNIEIRSFNLASPATSNPESYFLIENFLEKEASNIKFIILELQVILSIPDRNLHTSRAYYWMNFNEYLFTLKYYLPRIDCEPGNREAIKNFTYSFMENSLNIGMIMNMLTDNRTHLNYLGKYKNGYYPIEEELVRLQKERRAVLLSDTTILQKKLANYKKRFYRPQDSICNERVHLKRIKKLMDKAMHKNIHLIFVIPPLITQLEPLKELYDNIPEKNKINLGNGYKYPELYRFENAWDRAHLNTRGAGVFTSALAKEFMALVKSKPDEFSSAHNDE